MSVLRPFTNLGSKVVFANPELLVHVYEFLACVLQEELSGKQEECCEQVDKEKDCVQANGPSVVPEDCLSIWSQEFQAIHEQKSKSHEECEGKE